MARLDDIDIDIRNAVLRANATDREEIARILRYLYRLSEKLKWWQTKLDRGNLTEEERKVYEGLITGAEEIRQELAGKVDSDQMADATHNGLLSVLDWPKLQFNMIPKYTDMDYYAFNMGFHYASSAVAMTLTNYPTSDDSVMLCIGEPDYQYQIVIEVDRSTPKIYGRPVYFMEPWTAWKQLHWFDTATASSDGLMSAADKARMIGMPGYNLLPGYVGETTGTVGGSGAFKGFNIYESLAGLEGKPIAVSFDAKGTAGETLRVYAYQSSGLSIDVAQTDPVTCTLTADWKRFSFATHAKQWAGTLNNGMIAFWIQGGTNQFKLRKIKIETGLAATVWTPSAEDIAVS